MIQFPPTLIPHTIDVVALPRKPRAEMRSQVALVTPSLKLSNVASGGTLKLNFRNYPTQQMIIPNKHGALSPNPCLLSQLGFEKAWEFFEETTLSGHLAVQIDSTHQLWKRIAYRSQWLDQSLQGLSSVWRLIDFTHDNGAASKHSTNFTITILNELRTPSYV